MQRPAGREAVRRARQDDEQGRRLPALSAPGVRPGTRRENLSPASRTAAAVLAGWYRERLSSAIGIAFSAVGVGTIVFVPLAQYLVAHYDWRFAYRFLGAVVLVLVPIVAFALPWKRFYAGRHHAGKLQGRE